MPHKKWKKFVKDLNRRVEESRPSLPLSRGGSAPAPPPRSQKARPLPTRRLPPPPEGDFRWVQTEPFRQTIRDVTPTMPTKREMNIARAQEQRRNRPAPVIELGEIASRTQNQELEDALAMISADVPREFESRSTQFTRASLLPSMKKKRKVSKYQKEFGKQLKKLKAKHPRTKIQNLMKRAHAATRKALK